MAVSLADYVPSLKREVQPPGVNTFTGVTEAQWVGYLADAFWEARLDGLLEGFVVAGYDPDDASDSTIEPTSPGGSDITGADMALIILYAGIRMLRNQILNMQAGFRAKAGPVEYEVESASATVLVEMLKQLRAIKDRILETIDAGDSPVLIVDAFSTRLYQPLSYFGGPELSG